MGVPAVSRAAVVVRVRGRGAQDPHARHRGLREYLGAAALGPRVGGVGRGCLVKDIF